jgi:hypothetical protein
MTTKCETTTVPSHRGVFCRGPRGTFLAEKWRHTMMRVTISAVVIAALIVMTTSWLGSRPPSIEGQSLVYPTVTER